MSREHHGSPAEPRTRGHRLQDRAGRGPQNSGPDIPAPPFLRLFCCVGRRRGRKRKLLEAKAAAAAIFAGSKHSASPPRPPDNTSRGWGGQTWEPLAQFPPTMRAQLSDLDLPDPQPCFQTSIEWKVYPCHLELPSYPAHTSPAVHKRPISACDVPACPSLLLSETEN